MSVVPKLDTSAFGLRSAPKLDISVLGRNFWRQIPKSSPPKWWELGRDTWRTRQVELGHFQVGRDKWRTVGDDREDDILVVFAATHGPYSATPILINGGQGRSVLQSSSSSTSAGAVQWDQSPTSASAGVCNGKFLYWERFQHKARKDAYFAFCQIPRTRSFYRTI